MAIYGRTRGRLRISVLERKPRRSVRVLSHRQRRLTLEEEALLSDTYGLFTADRRAGNDDVDPALLERMTWCAVI